MRGKKAKEEKEKYETILSDEILIIFVEKKKQKKEKERKKCIHFTKNIFFYFSAYMCIDKNCHIAVFSN